MPASKAPDETFSELFHVRVLPNTKKRVDDFIKRAKEEREEPYGYPQFLREAIKEKLNGYGTLEKLFSSEIGKDLIEKLNLISPEDFHDFVAVKIRNYEITSEIYKKIKDPRTKMLISDEDIKKATQEMKQLEEKMEKRKKEEIKQYIEEDEEFQEILVKSTVKAIRQLPRTEREEFLELIKEAK
jgi:hypothetical protein